MDENNAPNKDSNNKKYKENKRKTKNKYNNNQ